MEEKKQKKLKRRNKQKEQHIEHTGSEKTSREDPEIRTRKGKPSSKTRNGLHYLWIQLQSAVCPTHVLTKRKQIDPIKNRLPTIIRPIIHPIICHLMESRCKNLPASSRSTKKPRRIDPSADRYPLACIPGLMNMNMNTQTIEGPFLKVNM
ncbi:hypothetical protein AAK899_04920 [Erysipelotrichaceae bacterium 51-3]